MQDSISESAKRKTTLSVIVPCYNETATLQQCIDGLLQIADETLGLDIIIIDDCSTDRSAVITKELERAVPEATLLSHTENCGKGAALRIGIDRSTGNLVAIQDADLEYD